jgi:peptide/nickel transport system permease protein
MLGLDVPAHVQYGRWIGVLPTPDWITDESHFKGLLQGTLGESLLGTPDSIEKRILARLPVTIELGVLAIVIGLVIALPVGIYSAMRQDTAADYVGRSAAILGMATPNFWLALMVVIYPALWWGWSPPIQWVPFTEDPLGNLGILIIPAVILGTALSAGTMRMTRTMMLEVLRQDYIRTAWSKGLNERVVIIRHALKNALIPIVTMIGMSLPLLIGGSVIIEQIFLLPGLGRLMLFALNERDYPVVSGVNLFFGAVVIGVNLMIDLIYPYLDPRVRYS